MDTNRGRRAVAVVFPVKEGENLFLFVHFLDLSFIVAILPLEANDIWDLGRLLFSHMF